MTSPVSTSPASSPAAVPFPFSAIVGQDEMKQAMRLAAVEPLLGGVLVFGDRGTGKTTAVRGLSALLPPIRVREGCSYNCEPERPTPSCTVCNAKRPPRIVKRPAPVVDLPLGATEDRVIGALDLERVLARGETVFEPGLLARAHRGFLYVDEINLLEDHLVDLLLDVSASGECVVEREGLSVRHPARFVLVGSGNPEEGELRPQLLDRFGLSVEVRSPQDLKQRMEVVRRRDAFERDRDGFVARQKRAEAAERRTIVQARERLDTIAFPDQTMEWVARLCIALGVDGLRGELTLMRAARALAALEGREEATREDVLAMTPSALRHRLRRDPLDEIGSSARVARAIDRVAGEVEGASGTTTSRSPSANGAPSANRAPLASGAQSVNGASVSGTGPASMEAGRATSASSVAPATPQSASRDRSRPSDRSHPLVDGSSADQAGMDRAGADRPSVNRVSRKEASPNDARPGSTIPVLAES